MSRVPRALAPVLVLALAGCAAATTAPEVIEPSVMPAGYVPHVTAVTVDTADGIWATDDDRADIQRRIVALLPDGTPGGDTWTMQVQLTRFDRGNAAARLFLIGMGQVHIEGTVTLTAPGSNRHQQYRIKKTFAGGGVVGGVTTTGDVEDGFAKSVVAGLTAQKP